MAVVNKGALQGTKTKFYKDIKSPIVAGMPFGKRGEYKMKKIGYDLIRIYFDSKEKDFTVGQQRIKRVIK